MDITIKTALISVSDKTGVVDFAKALAQMGVKIISTGGTARSLAEAGVKVVAIDSVTGFPEMMDGRVKTLHPKIHGGLLALRDKAEHVAGDAEARHRADRPGLRESLSLRADRRQARLHDRRGHREHRYRRPQHDPLGRQEPQIRHRGHQSGSVCPRHRADAEQQRRRRQQTAGGSGPGRVRPDRRLRRRHRQVSQRPGRRRVPGPDLHRFDERGDAPLRREPPPDGGPVQAASKRRALASAPASS